MQELWDSTFELNRGRFSPSASIGLLGLVTERKDLTMTHEQWWHEVGSGMPPLLGEDAHEHVRRVTAACWPVARLAIFEAEAAQIEAPLRAKIDALCATLKPWQEQGPWFLRENIAEAVAAEREECAKACEALQVNKSADYYPGQAFDGACRTCAGEIRKRPN